MLKAISGAACAALLAAPALAAEGACPAGAQLTVVRVSTLTPAGARAGFNKAVADHIKWYRDRGYTKNTITVADVAASMHDGTTAPPAKTEFLSIHRNSPAVTPEAHDAAWNAYVAEYRANSEITSEIVACLPEK